MKKIIKGSIRKAIGYEQVLRALETIGSASALNSDRLTNIETKIEQMQHQIELVGRQDSRLERLRQLAKDVESYQPAYNVKGVIEGVKRDCEDRCRVIERILSPLPGKRILDIGSSLGYVSYYLSDRGAFVNGWEYNPKNTEVAKLIGEINGVEVDFFTKEFDLESVKKISSTDFDAVIILSVLHHTNMFKGLDYTQKLMKELIDKIPVVVVELAKKGEDKKLKWDKHQPKNELDVFALVKDYVTIEKIAEFPNHLSDKTRPLYIVKRKNVVSVNGKNYTYSDMKNIAYKDSPLAFSGLRRRFYFGSDFIIKEYVFNAGDSLDRQENTIQILNEIQLLKRLPVEEIHNLPEIIDFEVTTDRAFVVLKRTEGDLLSDLDLGAEDKLKVFKDVICTLKDLHKLGVNHNDVRTWNIIVGKDKKGWLIDYGLAGPIIMESDSNAFISALVESVTNNKVSTSDSSSLKQALEKLPKEYTALKKLFTVSDEPAIKDIFIALNQNK